MIKHLPDTGALIIGGLGLFAALLLGGLAVLLGGRMAGGALRGQRHSQPPPSPGSIPPERQQHFSTSSAR